MNAKLTNWAGLMRRLIMIFAVCVRLGARAEPGSFRLELTACRREPQSGQVWNLPFGRLE